MDYATAIDTVLRCWEKACPRVFQQTDRQDLVEALMPYAEQADRALRFLTESGPFGQLTVGMIVSEAEINEVNRIFAAFGLSPQKFATFLQLRGEPSTQIAKMMKLRLQKEPTASVGFEAAKTRLFAELVPSFDVKIEDGPLDIDG